MMYEAALIPTESQDPGGLVTSGQTPAIVFSAAIIRRGGALMQSCRA
jgi:hypothetical protein